jgi:uncharacterized protein YbjT (DUF2867 family)
MVEGAGKSALVAGASGLVGSKLLPILLGAGDYARVHALTRRPLTIDHARLANRIVRFDAPLETQLKGLQCQDAFCCLGTTARIAGSQAAFRAVDHDLVLSFARFALKAGAERFVYISAMGASEASKYFYLQVKGATERSLEALRFRALDILSPSLLLGSRRSTRPLESLAQGAMSVLNPLLQGEWARVRAIPAETVAAAMLGAARGGRRGVNRYSYSGIRTLASSLTRHSTRL